MLAKQSWSESYPRDHVCRLAEVGTALHGIRFGEVVLDQSQANVVPHLVQLLIYFRIVAIKVSA